MWRLLTLPLPFPFPRFLLPTLNCLLDCFPTPPRALLSPPTASTSITTSHSSTISLSSCQSTQVQENCTEKSYKHLGSCTNNNELTPQEKQTCDIFSGRSSRNKQLYRNIYFALKSYTPRESERTWRVTSIKLTTHSLQSGSMKRTIFFFKPGDEKGLLTGFSLLYVFQRNVNLHSKHLSSRQASGLFQDQ